MKVVILAAGLGKRMGEFTKVIPKPLIKINNRPFLYYLLENIKNLGRDTGVIVGYKKEEIIKFCRKHGIKVSFIEQKGQNGTGHAVKYAKGFVGDENFIVVMGDNYYSEEDLKKVCKDDNINYIAVIRSKCPERYGVVVERNGFLKKIVEKPKCFVNNIVNTGLYKFTPEIFKALEKIKLSERGEYELTDAIKLLAKENKVKVVEIKDWLDLGCPDDVSKIEDFFKSLDKN